MEFESEEDKAKFEAFQKIVQEQVQEEFNKLHTANTTKSTETVTQEDDETKARRNLRNLIDPIYGQDINEAKLASSAAIDESRFYRKYPNAVEYEAEVEKLFDESLKNGRPTTRETILKYIVGNEALTEPEKFDKRREARKTFALSKARDADDMTGNTSGRDREALAKFDNFRSKTTKEMEEALADVII